MSEHKHGCGCECHDDHCGCNDDHCGCNNDHCDCQEQTVTLTLDNDEELECIVLTIFSAGEYDYIALLPISDDDEEEESDVFIYRFSDVDGEPHLDNIQDDDEYIAAANAFDEWLEAQDYDELSEEE